MNCMHCGVEIFQDNGVWWSKSPSGLTSYAACQDDRIVSVRHEPASPVAQPDNDSLEATNADASTTFSSVAQSGAGEEPCIAHVSTSGVEGTYEMCGKPSIVRFNGKPYCSELHSRDARHYAALRPSPPSEQAAAPLHWTESLAKLRDDGWMVAVHNDYRQNGKAHTFWLLTRVGREGQFVKGEGDTDGDAIAQIIRQLSSHAASPTGGAEPSAEEWLKHSGIRNVVIRSEGTPHEQTFAATLEAYAAQTNKALLERLDTSCRIANEHIQFHRTQATSLQAADVKRAQDISRLTVERDEAREQLEQAMGRNIEYLAAKGIAEMQVAHLNKVLEMTSSAREALSVHSQMMAAEAQLATARDTLRELYSEWNAMRAVHAPGLQFPDMDKRIVAALAKEPK